MNPSPTERLVQAEGIIKQYALYSGASGLIPVPFINWAGVLTLQAFMVSDIAKTYGVEATAKDRIRTLIVALIASVFQKEVGQRLGRGFALFIPVVGTIAGILATPVMAYATTVAVGRVFATHFESGGSLLDFDPVKMRAAMKAEYAGAQSPTPAAVGLER